MRSSGWNGARKNQKPRSTYAAQGASEKTSVGEVRPSQMLYTYGIGAVVDLPRIAAMVMGLDDWDINYCLPLEEERLLAAVRQAVGDQVQSLRIPPLKQDSGVPGSVDENAHIGVPVAAFPRWMVCPMCRLLSSIGSGLFELKPNFFRSERTCYVHSNCPKAGKPPEVLPVRFLLACKNGHLDDFPWRWFCHQGPSECRGPLRLFDAGIAGEAADLFVRCDACEASRRLSHAFGEEAWKSLPQECSRRRPHLRDTDEDPCDQRVKCILLGASNAWFPLTLSTLYLPVATDPLGQLVEEHWSLLESISAKVILEAYKKLPPMAPTLAAFAKYSDDALLASIEAKRNQRAKVEPSAHIDIRTPEWQMLCEADPVRNGSDFFLNPVAAPEGYEKLLEQTVLVERLREVKALVGFTRIESPGEFSDAEEVPEHQCAPLSRRPPLWVPATEVRGEGIFLRFNAEELERWASRLVVQRRGAAFLRAYQRWLAARSLPQDLGFPGMGYVLLHSFSHALMRQLVLECGYTAASIRERLYWAQPGHNTEPMAGVLLYTAAPDSEGTLGGLVSLGRPKVLGRHITQALEMMRLCASDPLCAEHLPPADGATLHGASCHACLFGPETSCERSNKYLDRSVLVATLENSELAFFPERD